MKTDDAAVARVDLRLVILTRQAPQEIDRYQLAQATHENVMRPMAQDELTVREALRLVEQREADACRLQGAERGLIAAITMNVARMQHESMNEIDGITRGDHCASEALSIPVTGEQSDSCPHGVGTVPAAAGSGQSEASEKFGGSCPSIRSQISMCG